jgi:hypothetical protein
MAWGPILLGDHLLEALAEHETEDPVRSGVEIAGESETFDGRRLCRSK